MHFQSIAYDLIVLLCFSPEVVEEVRVDARTQMEIDETKYVASLHGVFCCNISLLNGFFSGKCSLRFRRDNRKPRLRNL